MTDLQIATVLSGSLQGECVAVLAGAGGFYECELSIKDDEDSGDIVTLSESELRFWKSVTEVNPKIPVET